MLGLFGIALQVVPADNPSTWVTDAAYSPTALRNGEEGRVGYQLDVDSLGRVVGCRVTVRADRLVLMLEPAPICYVWLDSGWWNPQLQKSSNTTVYSHTDWKDTHQKGQ